MYLPALPPPAVLSITRNIEVEDAEDVEFVQIQQRIVELSEANYQIWRQKRKKWKLNFDELRNNKHVRGGDRMCTGIH